MLRLSPAAKSRYSAGELMNIVTTDVQRIRMFWFQLRDFLYCPMMVNVKFCAAFSNKNFFVFEIQAPNRWRKYEKING